MKFRHLTVLILLALVASCTSSSSVSEEEELFEEITLATEDFQDLITDDELVLFDLVNAYRASIGLNELTFSVAAYPDAEEHTGFMIMEDMISHKNFNARANSIAEKTNATYIAENVAKNYPTPEEALEGWLASPAHKNTIEGDFNHTSISIKKNGLDKLFYTQIFFKK